VLVLLLESLHVEPHCVPLAVFLLHPVLVLLARLSQVLLEALFVLDPLQFKLVLCLLDILHDLVHFNFGKGVAREEVSLLLSSLPRYLGFELRAPDHLLLESKAPQGTLKP
jgi:hypothetical protein